MFVSTALACLGVFCELFPLAKYQKTITADMQKQLVTGRATPCLLIGNIQEATRHLKIQEAIRHLKRTPITRESKNTQAPLRSTEYDTSTSQRGSFPRGYPASLNLSVLTRTNHEVRWTQCIYSIVVSTRLQRRYAGHRDFREYVVILLRKV